MAEDDDQPEVQFIRVEQPRRRDPDYMGDGVYASHDGYQIWLTTQQGMAIALEREVLEAVNRYAKRIGLAG